MLGDTTSADPLAPHRIPGLPQSFYYIPRFLSPAEEAALLQKIPSKRWTQLSKRRLQAHPSTLTANNVLISAPLPPWLTTTPRIAERFAQLGVFGGTKHGAANHVLINEYKPGEGIMPHEDGAAYAPVVATISLGAAIVLDLYEKSAVAPSQPDGEGQADYAVGSAERDEAGRQVPRYRILQEPGSLLVTTGEAYGVLLHGISPLERDDNLGPETVANWELLGDKSPFAGGSLQRQTRISLTYRDVLKVSKVGIGILGKK